MTNHKLNFEIYFNKIQIIRSHLKKHPVCRMKNTYPEKFHSEECL